MTTSTAAPSKGGFYVGASPLFGSKMGRTRAESGVKGAFYPRGPAPSTDAEAVSKIEGAPGVENAVKGSWTGRKLSFSRKAGRKIVRSLSFGAEPPKRDVAAS